MTLTGRAWWAHDREVERGDDCPACGSETLLYRVEQMPRAERRVFKCTLCGKTHDVDKSTDAPRYKA